MSHKLPCATPQQLALRLYELAKADGVLSIRGLQAAMLDAAEYLAQSAIASTKAAEAIESLKKQIAELTSDDGSLWPACILGTDEAQAIVDSFIPSATLPAWVEAEKAKADAYEDAARICEEMSYPPEGRERWANKDEEWAAIKLEDAARSIRERKAKKCQVTQVAATDRGIKHGD